MSDQPPEATTVALTPSEELHALIAGAYATQLVYVAAKLGLADLLADGPRPSVDAAARVGADATALHRVMRGLARIGVLDEQPDGRFALTPAGALLRAGAPGSLRGLALAHGEENWAACGALLDGVRTGETPFDRVHGVHSFAYYTRNPEARAQFSARMAARAREEIPGVLRAYDFAAASRVVDVAGGLGATLAGILAARPGARGVLFDLPEVVADAPATLAAAGVADRCEVVGGDFFRDDLPAGDAYVLSLILHDWDDAGATAILRRVRAAMAPDAAVVIIEKVLPARVVRPPGPPTRMDPVNSDIRMLVITGGRERTEAEFGALLADAGLRLVRVVPTGSPDGLSVIEGAAADPA